MSSLVLASRSPQRRAILERLGVSFSVRPADVEELHSGDALELVHANALRKALAVCRPGAGEAVLGCDTLVRLRGATFGKPADLAGARRTLQALSGATHEVLSAVAIVLDGEQRRAFARTQVRFRELDQPLLEWYLARGEWRDRAGAYAIQGAGAALVRELTGDYENVVGLPLASLLDVCPELLTGELREAAQS